MSCSGSVDFGSGGVPEAREGGRRTRAPSVIRELNLQR